jgi:hypothetical protein
MATRESSLTRNEVLLVDRPERVFAVMLRGRGRLDTLRETAVNNPISALTAVAGISFLLGVVWARRD